MPELRTNVPDPDLGRGLVYQVGEILKDFASGTYTLTIPAGTLVLGVFAAVTEAMDGSPTLTLGDGDDADGYLDSSDIAPGTAGSVTTPAVKSSNTASFSSAFLGGKYYATADTLDAVWTAGTSPTTGRVIFGYWGIRIDKFGLAKTLTNAAAGTF